MGRRVSFDSSNIRDFPQHGVTVQRKPDRLYVMCRKFYLDAKGQRHEHRVYVGHVNQGAFYTSEESYKRRVIAQQAQLGITLSAHQIDYEPGIEKLSLHQVHMLQQFYQLNPEFVRKSPITVLALARRLQDLATNAEHELWQNALKSLSLDKLPDPGDLTAPNKDARPRKNAVPSAEDILLEAQIDIFNFTTSAEFKSWLTLNPFEPQALMLKTRTKTTPRQAKAQSSRTSATPSAQESQPESKAPAATQSTRKSDDRAVSPPAEASQVNAQVERQSDDEATPLAQHTADHAPDAEAQAELAAPGAAAPHEEPEAGAQVGAAAQDPVQAACAAAETARKSVPLGAELQVDTLSGLSHIAQYGARALGTEGPLTLGMWLNRPHPNGAQVALDEHSPVYYMARYRVYEADCNRWGFLTEQRLLAFCQHARLDFFLEQLSFDLEAYLLAQKLYPVQVESQARYFAPIVVGTEIVVSVVPLKVQRSSICYYQEIRDRAGILRFAQKSRHACCEQSNGRQVSVPEPIMAALIPYMPQTPIPEAL